MVPWYLEITEDAEPDDRRFGLSPNLIAQLTDAEPRRVATTAITAATIFNGDEAGNRPRLVNEPYITLKDLKTRSSETVAYMLKSLRPYPEAHGVVQKALEYLFHPDEHEDPLK